MTLWQSRRTKDVRRLGRPPRRIKRILGWIAGVAFFATLLAAAAPALHLLGTKPYLIYPAHNHRIPVAAVLVSGDIGFSGGMSAHVASAMAERGMTVVGVSSPVLFGFHRSQDQAVKIVEQAIRTALKISGAPRIVLVGQSFGADIVATTAPHLPRDILAKIAAIDLMVPGRNVYFRADPIGIAYMGDADAHPAPALRAFRGPPLICIWGVKETDSLCPLLHGVAAITPLPGNHYLEHNHVRLVAAAMGALHKLVPAIRP